MGIFNKNNAGIRCETLDENGETHHCQIFRNDKEGKLATGTDIVVNVSRANNCEPIFQGNFDIVDGDEAQINKIVSQKVKTCKRGLAG